MKVAKCAFIFFILLNTMSCATTPKKEESPFKNYTVVIVRNFSSSPTSAYPDSAGPSLSARLVYWLRYYNSKHKFFDGGVLLEGTHEVGQEHILFLKGEFKGFSILYQFVDESTGTVIKEGTIEWKDRNLSYIQRLIELSALHIAEITFSAEED